MKGFALHCMDSVVNCRCLSAWRRIYEKSCSMHYVLSFGFLASSSYAADNKDEVIINFVENLKKLDLDEMLKCCAIDDYVKYNDFANEVSYINTFIVGKHLFPKNTKYFKT